VPAESMAHTHIAQFNSLESVRRRFEENLNHIACVIVEPIMLNMGVTEPEPGFLQGLKDLCGKYGAVLIFDEVKTGVKIARGGATEHYKVRPDIVVLAKAIGGGLPLAAFGASAEIMEEIASMRVIHVGTYSSNPLALAAAEATLKEVLTPAAYEHTFALNRKLVDGYAALVREHGLPCYANGVGSMGTINFKRERMRDYRDWVTSDYTFYEALAPLLHDLGVLCEPDSRAPWFVCEAHDDRCLGETLERFETAVNAVVQSARPAAQAPFTKYTT